MSTTISAPPATPFVDIVREFDAPVAAVFRAHTDPALVRQWLGPRGLEMEIERYDAVTGGVWQYVHRSPEGAFAFRGVFHTVRTDALIVQTFEFDGAPDAVVLSSATFTEVDGRTRLQIHEIYPTAEARDLAVAAGMEYGVVEGYERLDELLAGVAAV
jgi:uncharacterized protein YndB with AHSA1/START domain